MLTLSVSLSHTHNNFFLSHLRPSGRDDVPSTLQWVFSLKKDILFLTTVPTIIKISILTLMQNYFLICRPCPKFISCLTNSFIAKEKKTCKSQGSKLRSHCIKLSFFFILEHFLHLLVWLSGCLAVWLSAYCLLYVFLDLNSFEE